ncbi:MULTISPECIES: class I SAM-dependent methyltransferase [unclassified Microbacterium]|uniref:class I SAM-dependent methyltransferase n=1 Tax=unclassified Microbacterium TaxID=2609290 RepID=UPI00386960E0
MGSDHYFSASPSSFENLRRIRVSLAGRDVEVTTAGGVFSPDHVDGGTAVLLANTPPAPPGGHLLDLGCGWGPIALSLAIEAPHATVWAVDVNERALDLVRRNAEELGLDNVNAVRPEDVPDDISFRSLRSNPPIRVGKDVLHGMLQTWIPRLAERGDAWLVVQRNLGSDSLQRWLTASFDRSYSVTRAATGRGFRVLRVRRNGGSATGPIAVTDTAVEDTPSGESDLAREDE